MKTYFIILLVALSIGSFGQTITKEEFRGLSIKNVESIAPHTCPMYYSYSDSSFGDLKPIIPHSPNHLTVRKSSYDTRIWFVNEFNLTVCKSSSDATVWIDGEIQEVQLPPYYWAGHYPYIPANINY